MGELTRGMSVCWNLHVVKYWHIGAHAKKTRRVKVKVIKKKVAKKTNRSKKVIKSC